MYSRELNKQFGSTSQLHFLPFNPTILNVFSKTFPTIKKPNKFSAKENKDQRGGGGGQEKISERRGEEGVRKVKFAEVVSLSSPKTT